MKKILALLVGVFALFSNLNASQNVIKLGTSADYKPFEYLDDSGNIVGFDIDLVNAITEITGIKFEPQNIPFDALIPSLKGGKINAAMSAMSATDARRKHVDFSIPYYTLDNLFIQRTGSGLKDKTSLKGKRVGASLGTLQESAARAIEGADVVMFDNVASAILGLKATKVDAVIVDSSVGYGYIKQNKGELDGFYSEPDGSEGICIAFKKGTDPKIIEKINNAIEQIKQSGEFKKLLEKHDLL